MKKLKQSVARRMKRCSRLIILKVMMMSSSGSIIHSIGQWVGMGSRQSTGQEFKCEICGNLVTRGVELSSDISRLHQHGMGCLGIPNTNNFNEEAQLWKTIQVRYALAKMVKFL